MAIGLSGQEKDHVRLNIHTAPYATPPLGVNGLPIMEFIQPLPQAIVQLTFPTLAETLAESLTASGVLNTNTSGASSASTETTTAMTTGGLAGALASLDTSQGVFVLPFDFA